MTFHQYYHGSGSQYQIPLLTLQEMVWNSSIQRWNSSMRSVVEKPWQLIHLSTFLAAIGKGYHLWTKPSQLTSKISQELCVLWGSGLNLTVERGFLFPLTHNMSINYYDCYHQQSVNSVLSLSGQVLPYWDGVKVKGCLLLPVTELGFSLCIFWAWLLLLCLLLLFLRER